MKTEQWRVIQYSGCFGVRRGKRETLIEGRGYIWGKEAAIRLARMRNRKLTKGVK